MACELYVHSVAFTQQVQSQDPHPEELLSLGHQKWVCQVAPERGPQNICSQWVKSHPDLCHRILCFALKWLSWLL